jgi:hypothetical protein
MIFSVFENVRLTIIHLTDDVINVIFAGRSVKSFSLLFHC